MGPCRHLHNRSRCLAISVMIPPFGRPPLPRPTTDNASGTWHMSLATTKATVWGALTRRTRFISLPSLSRVSPILWSPLAESPPWSPAAEIPLSFSGAPPLLPSIPHYWARAAKSLLSCTNATRNTPPEVGLSYTSWALGQLKLVRTCPIFAIPSLIPSRSAFTRPPEHQSSSALLSSGPSTLVRGMPSPGTRTFS